MTRHPLPIRLAVVAVAAATAAVPFARAQEPQKLRLTYEDTARPIQWTSNVPQARFSDDGAWVVVSQGKSEVWFDAKTGAEGKPAAASETKPAAESTAVHWTARIHEGDLFLEPSRAGVRDGGGRRGRRGFPGGGGGGGAPGEDAVRVTTDGDAAGKKQEAHCNDAGTFASFVRGGDFFVVDVGKKTTWQVTKDGAQDQMHGLLDWVYQEEVYGRGDFQGHWWSAGDLVAVLSLDEAPVREFTIVNHVPPGFLDKERTVTTEVANYPKAGDPNPFASLQVVDGKNQRTVQVDLAAFPKDVIVVRVEWSPAGQLLVTLQDRIQTWAEFGSVDVATGKFTRWIREESKTWVNRPESPRWLADGTFLWHSERTGYQHIYRYKAGGELVNAVTSGDWQVRGIERIDEATQTIFFEASKDGAMGRHVYRGKLAGGDVVCITPGVGVHQAELSADGSAAIDRWSAMDMPPVVQLVDTVTGKVTKELGRAGTGDADKYAFAEKVRLSIPTRDGDHLDGSLMLPTDRKDGARYPIYLPTYSGPDAPSVRDAWQHGTYQQFCAQQGFLVLQVNVRTASSRGQQHIGLCYQNLGAQELKDLEDAVAFVCKEYQGDAARVAIEGWSYGGFMAAYALTHSDKFALGLAGAGVYDWRLYDSIYTERYMRLPDENKAGYDASSVIKAAKNLKGHLVLLHGSMDDNVHLQNTMQLLWELEKAGKQNFELMIYPRSQHGLAREVAGHSRAYQWRCLQRLLDPQWKAD